MTEKRTPGYDEVAKAIAPYMGLSPQELEARKEEARQIRVREVLLKQSLALEKLKQSGIPDVFIEAARALRNIYPDTHVAISVPTGVESEDIEVYIRFNFQHEKDGFFSCEQINAKDRKGESFRLTKGEWGEIPRTEKPDGDLFNDYRYTEENLTERVARSLGYELHALWDPRRIAQFEDKGNGNYRPLFSNRGKYELIFPSTTNGEVK